MKKTGLLPAIFCVCCVAMISCGQDSKNKDLPLVAAGNGSGFQSSEIMGPESVSATDGTHSDKIGVNWEPVEGAISYRIYRSETVVGPFDPVGSIPASNLNNSGNDGTGSIPDEPSGTQAVFQSDVDLNVQNYFLGIPTYRGVFVQGGSTCKIHIALGTTTYADVAFSGHTLGSYYTQDEVVSMINAAVGKTVCYPVTDGDSKYIKIISTEGRITLENINNPVFYVPLGHFLKKGAGINDIITVEPVPVDDGDGGGQSQPEANYFFTDTNVITGKHYYYKVTAMMDENTESSYSPADEGFSLDVNAPGKVLGVVASDGTYPDKVTVSWQAVEGATMYRVFRSDCKKVMVQVGGDVTATSIDDTTVPAGEFTYKVVPFGGTLEGIHSDPDRGFRTVTNEEFFIEFMNSINYTSKRIKSFGGLGNETITAENSAGTCTYGSSGGLSGATVLITYIDFCDLYMTMNGTQHTVITNVFSQQGTLKNCRIDVTGVYTGYVRYDLVISGGKPSGGYYYVSQNGGPETQISYNYQK